MSGNHEKVISATSGDALLRRPLVPRTVPQSPSSYVPLQPLSAYAQSPSKQKLFRARPVLNSQGVEKYAYPEVDFDALESATMHNIADDSTMESLGPVVPYGSGSYFPGSQGSYASVGHMGSFNPIVSSKLGSPKRSEGYGFPQVEPDILVLRLHCLYQVFPLIASSSSSSRPSRVYKVIPFVQQSSGDIAGYPIQSVGVMPGPAPGSWTHILNSEVLRYAFQPDRPIHFKILEVLNEKVEFLGVATLSPLTETPLSAPLVPPEQVINRPEFRASFPIQGRDGIIRGLIVVSKLFDYSRPGEVAWPDSVHMTGGGVTTTASAESDQSLFGGRVDSDQIAPLLTDMRQLGRRNRPYHSKEQSMGILDSFKFLCMDAPDFFC
eukprot:Protomagalhaensia_sp_Gyna_25__971@NODE_146_length_4895_cov_17_531507_g113_i0_p3_GENE_NODE_146_length_4895_cov_17_531507_g113_i0NODE_146_length_4895_cov_17_531507_g113_i0_p3_ORF_typecomplete_len380_score49_57_NODE_146_length_4895_cov_17_531507_g113_i034344573